MFDQLNHIQAAVWQVPVSEIEEQTETWWSMTAAKEAGRPWRAHRRCGPWCHPGDWKGP